MRTRGFTLMEVLVYVAVVAIVILAVLSFFSWSVKSNVKIKAQKEVLDNAKRAMEIMASEIREAKSIYTPTSVFSVSAGQLSLETIKYLPPGESSGYIDFFICGQQICLKKESQNPIALNSNETQVEILEFWQVLSDLNDPSIQINLKLKYNSDSTVDLKTTASLRSY